jgi:hypothetical protein
MICSIWSIPNLSSHFKEIVIPKPGITWTYKGQDLYEYLKKTYDIDAHQVDAGVSNKDFYPTKEITNIKKIGLNGVPFVNSGWDQIKRPQLLIDIAKGIGGEAVFIHGKGLEESHTMYNDIDMYICTSVNDRGPYGIAEAAFCKIPVLSTKTGLALQFNSIKTFDTAEEAIEIINYFNNNPEQLKIYIDEVYEELYSSMSWDSVVEKYWKPLFKHKLSLNNSK